MKFLSDPIAARLFTDAELSAAIAANKADSAPLYAQLEAMGEDIFLPRSWRYIPAAQVVADAIEPFAQAAVRA